MDHSECAAFHKEELEKQNELALKKDMSVHEDHMKKASKKREENIAEKQDSLIQSDVIDHTWHTNMKEIEEREKEEAVKQDVNLHKTRMTRATHHQQELAAKQHTEAERMEHDIEEHRKKAAQRKAAGVPE